MFCSTRQVIRPDVDDLEEKFGVAHGSAEEAELLAVLNYCSISVMSKKKSLLAVRNGSATTTTAVVVVTPTPSVRLISTKTNYGPPVNIEN